MATMIYQTAYFSSASGSITESDVAIILANAQTKNKALGVTGMLLLMDQVFFQVLEGDRQVVEDLIARIEKNPLHGGLIRVHSVEREERLFPGWSMGFEKFVYGVTPGATLRDLPFDMSELANSRSVQVLAKHAPEILVFMRSLYSSRYMVGAPSLGLPS